MLRGIRPKMIRSWYRLLGYGCNGRVLDVLPDDVYLVGYPKSGNTWLDFLVASMLAPSCKNVNFLTVEQYVADIYFNSAKQLKALKQPRHLKSHEPYDARYGKVVYIVRDPRDVVVSYYYHHLKLRMIDEQTSISAFVSKFVAGDLDALGAWGEHVGRWLHHRQDDDAFLLVRYELLKKNTADELSRIASFLGLSIEWERRLDVIQWCSSDHMRSLERQQHDHPSFKHTRQDIPFVRKAVAGGWQSALNHEDVGLIVDRWGGVMTELGYAH